MQQYLPLKQRSAHLGDEYYRCLNETLTKPRSQRHFDECVSIARKYRTALRKQLRDLKRLEDQRFIQREAELIDKYLKLVENDLNSLTKGQIDKILKDSRSDPMSN